MYTFSAPPHNRICPVPVDFLGPRALRGARIDVTTRANVSAGRAICGLRNGPVRSILRVSKEMDALPGLTVDGARSFEVPRAARWTTWSLWLASAGHTDRDKRVRAMGGRGSRRAAVFR